MQKKIMVAFSVLALHRKDGERANPKIASLDDDIA
jgi:hypothetical protein